MIDLIKTYDLLPSYVVTAYFNLITNVMTVLEVDTGLCFACLFKVLYFVNLGLEGLAPLSIFISKSATKTASSVSYSNDNF